MKKLIVLFIVMFCFSASLLLAEGTQPPRIEIDGVIYYTIYNSSHLIWISDNLIMSRGQNYLQTGDIDASGTRNLNYGFLPIGNNEMPFSGTFNGRGHTINDLYISASSIQHNVGLFGVTSHAIIENLGLTNVNISGSNNVGALVGTNLGSNIKNCHTTGQINYTPINSQIMPKNLGGLVGGNFGSTIQECYSKVNLNINDPLNTTPIRIGGFIGENYVSTILNSYSRGEIVVEYDSTLVLVSSFVAFTSNDTIRNCYTSVNINRYGFGFIALDRSHYDPSVITNSFWSTDNSSESDGGTGITTLEMKDMSTYLDAGWDFIGETENGEDNIWGINPDINSGYPFLALEGYEHNPQVATNDNALVNQPNFNLGNYPNPFNPSTKISFDLPEAGNVELKVYNARGQKVKTLINKELPAGKNYIFWDGKDNNGKKVASGTYLYKIKSGRYTATKKMVLMK